MKVLALDPGERIGWAAGTIYDSFGPVKAAGGAQLHVDNHGMAYIKDMSEALRSVDKYDLVVIERFRLTARGAKVKVGSEFPEIQFIGMVKQRCWDAGVPYKMQEPKDMRTARAWLKTDHPSAADVAARVARCDEVAHDDGHDGSALLHLWHYFFKKCV